MYFLSLESVRQLLGGDTPIFGRTAPIFRETPNFWGTAPVLGETTPIFGGMAQNSGGRD